MTMGLGLYGQAIRSIAQNGRTSLLKCVAKVVDKKSDPVHASQIAVQEDPDRASLVKLRARNALQFRED